MRWLYQRLFVENRGCLLTDEMGLGKTVQVACCLAAGLFAASYQGPVLVLCPPTLVRNWGRELCRWGPFAVEAEGNERQHLWRQVLTPHGAGRQRVKQRLALSSEERRGGRYRQEGFAAD